MALAIGEVEMHAYFRPLLFTFITALFGAVISLDTGAQSPASDSLKDSSRTIRDHRTTRPSETSSPTGSSVTVRDHRTTPPSETVPIVPSATGSGGPNLDQTPQSFWTTLPGILTGIAGVIGAIAALVAAFRSRGR